MGKSSAIGAADSGGYRYGIEEWDNEAARYALGHKAPGQRQADASLVKVFHKVWDSGRWHPGIGAPIAFSDDGVMQNGTHRATFISGLPDGVRVPVLVFRGMPAWAIEHYDTGKNRTLGNFLKYAYPDKTDTQCKVAASIATICMNYEGPPELPRVDMRPRPEELVDWALQHGERLFYAAEAALNIVGIEKAQVGTVGTARTYGFVLYYLPESADFFRTLAAREGLTLSDPRGAMTHFYSRKGNAFERGAQSRQITQKRIAELLGCWHAYRSGTKWLPWDRDIKESEPARGFKHPVTAHGKTAPKAA